MLFELLETASDLHLAEEGEGLIGMSMALNTVQSVTRAERQVLLLRQPLQMDTFYSNT